MKISYNEVIKIPKLFSISIFGESLLPKIELRLSSIWTKLLIIARLPSSDSINLELIYKLTSVTM